MTTSCRSMDESVRLTNRLRAPFNRYRRLIKFGIVGASGTVVGLGVLYSFTDIVGLHYLLSNVIAFTCSVSNNYLLNSKWTFNDKETSSTGYLRYIGTCLLGLGVNETVLWLFTTVAGLWYMLSAVIAILCAFLVNYALSKRLVWTRSKS